jgi:hypothetical protein
VLVGAGHVTADGTPSEVKAAAGAGRIVRFRLLGGNPERFATIPGVTSVQADQQHLSLHTTDADTTIWALYDQRTSIADIAVSEASLEVAFLSLGRRAPGPLCRTAPSPDSPEPPPRDPVKATSCIGGSCYQRFSSSRTASARRS